MSSDFDLQLLIPQYDHNPVHFVHNGGFWYICATDSCPGFSVYFLVEFLNFNVVDKLWDSVLCESGLEKAIRRF